VTAGLAFECPECAESVEAAGSDDVGRQCAACGHGFQSVDGILRIQTAAGDASDYPPELYELLVEAEERHFWFGVRNEIVLSMMRRAGCRAGATVLDVGCGTGFMLRGIEAAGLNGCGIDMHLTGLRHARRRVSGLLFQDTAVKLPFAAQFEWVLLCDVIEHAEDDVALLRQAMRAAHDDGQVVVTVPALPALWSDYDEAIGHKRRYTRATLSRAMRRAGLTPTLVRYFNAITVPIELVRRRLVMPARSPAGRDASDVPDSTDAIVRSAVQVPPAPINRLLRWVALAELRVARLGLPFGSSLVAIGRRHPVPPPATSPPPSIQ